MCAVQSTSTKTTNTVKTLKVAIIGASKTYGRGFSPGPRKSVSKRRHEPCTAPWRRKENSRCGVTNSSSPFERLLWVAYRHLSRLLRKFIALHHHAAPHQTTLTKCGRMGTPCRDELVAASRTRIWERSLRETMKHSDPVVSRSAFLAPCVSRVPERRRPRRSEPVC